ALGLDELASDPAYATAPARVQNAAELRAIIEDVLGTDTRDNWIARLRENEVLGNRVNDLGDWMAEPHVTQTGGVSMADQPGLGMIPRPAAQGLPGHVPAAAPVAGQDTDAVLRDLGIDPKRIEALRKAGAFG
ncbi:MAG TPA: CoA transferase, partial [Thermohalobaculum sp.]|nr:CoA transferase [Thermohalobaculum sp.]